MPEVSLIPLSEFKDAMVKAAEDALRANVAEPVLDEARMQAPISPTPYKWYHDAGSEIGPRGGRYDWVLPGRLRESGRIEPAEGVERVTPTEYRVRIKFGNEEVKYAAVQHEELTFHHTDGKAKYLEDPLKAKIAGMAKDMTPKISAAIKAVGDRPKVAK